jgi:cobalt-zinc-cadmium efflux system membrane fusion protein
MRTVITLCAGFTLGAAVLFALASFGIIGKASPPAAPGGHEEGGHAEGEKGGGEGHGEGGHEDESIQLAPESKELAEIELAPAERRRLAKTLTFPAEVTIPSGRLSHVGPRVEGAIHHVMVEVGATVKEGDLLAVLDSIPMGEAKAAYLKALAEQDLAEKTVARERELVKTAGSARKELIEAETGLATAAIELRSAKERLHLLGLGEEDVARVPQEKGEDRAHISIFAPLAGIVLERHATPGEFVRPEEQLFTIANLDLVWVIASVPEKDVHVVQTGVTATVRVAAQPHETFEGKVTYIAPQVDAKTRMIQVRIEVPNEKRRLKPAMFAEGALPASETVEAVAVPISAVQRLKGDSVVFVSTDGKRFERRVVELGVQSDGYVEARGDLKAGEPVVVKGAFLVKSEFEKEAISEGHAH